MTARDPRLPLLRQLLDLPIRWKLNCLLAILVLNLLAVIALAGFGMSLLSSLRAYVGGEGLWAKAQKGAAFHLSLYAVTGNEDEYRAYLNELKIPLGDHRARLAMQAPSLDRAEAARGFIRGGIYPDDIPGMLLLFRRFRGVGYIVKATEIWTEGDALLEQLQGAAAGLHAEIGSAHPSPARMRSILRQIESINLRLTALENQFSYTLGQASRWAKRLLFWTMFAGSMLLGVLSLLIGRLISGAVASGIGAVAGAATRAADGDLGVRVALDSRDESGRLAEAFNRMMEMLSARTAELERSNAQLEQFAYAAAHDLREPLRKISSFAELLQLRERGRLGPEADGFITRIVEGVTRMAELIDGLLEYSQVSRQQGPFGAVDTRNAYQDAVANLQAAIEETRAVVQCEALPVVRGDRRLLTQLLQNLIGNGIKFRREGAPRVTVKAERDRGRWVFSVKDNGIGIDERYKDQLFVIFRRLHTRAEFPGNGIGLAVCKSIVERHGGSIWVESRLGEGSTFRFTLPDAGGEPASA